MLCACVSGVWCVHMSSSVCRYVLYDLVCGYVSGVCMCMVWCVSMCEWFGVWVCVSGMCMCVAWCDCMCE